MLDKLKNEKVILAVVGLVVTIVNSILDESFTQEQMYTFAAIIVAFILKPRDVTAEDLTNSFELAIERLEIKQQMKSQLKDSRPPE